ncbi:MAG TPA: carboxylesterase [Planctomycetes bacterium]|nr:carboxylesterase [Planctomycetota bacterium]HIN81047.1 carboxylesterase [Planctomycetota bacterium]
MTQQPLPAVVIETAAEPDCAVIWLHGLGADGHDFEPIVPHLGLPEDLAVRFVFPHAPSRAVTINNGMVMPAWYDILEVSNDRRVDEKGILASAEMIVTLIEDQVHKGGISEDAIVLAGFSQGGAMACHVGLRYPRPLAGIIVLSAYLPLPEKIEAEASDANRETPILACHGDWDPVVPRALGESSANRLRELGHEVQWHSYPCPHSVHPEEITDIGRWLTARLRKEAH